MRKWSPSALRKELGTSSCLCGLVVIVGVNKKGVISKGMVGCPVSSFATLIETQKKRYLEHDNFISHTTLLQYPKTLAYNIALHILSSSVLTRLSSWPSTVYRNMNILDRRGVARGVLGCPWPPLGRPSFEQTTHNIQVAKTSWQYLGRKSHCWKAHFFKICFFVQYFVKSFCL